MTAIKYMHHTPGRLRLKGHHFMCQGERARRGLDAMRAMKGVELVQLNCRAGSLTVRYNPSVHSQEELLEALENAGCLHLDTGTRPSRPVNHAPSAGGGVADLFGKALVGALAQRTATKLIGALL